MVLVPPTSYRQAYSHLITSALTPPLSPILLFVSSSTPDALFASKILTALFTHDCVPYRIIPVMNWQQVHHVVDREMGYITVEKFLQDEGATLDDLAEDVSLANHLATYQSRTGEDEEATVWTMPRDKVEISRQFIFIDLANLISMTEVFPILPKNNTVHIIDSHRPMNLWNLFSQESEGKKLTDLDNGDSGDWAIEVGKVWVWDDGDGEKGLEEEKKVFKELEFLPPDDDDDDDFDDDEADNFDLSEEEEEEEDAMDEDGGNPTRKKRRRLNAGKKRNLNQRRLSPQLKHRYRKRENKYYNQGTFYGMSVAYQVYLLATLLERADEDMLWLAILGLTHQFTSSLIDRERYEHWVSALSDEVSRLSTPPLAGLNPNTLSALNGNQGPSGLGAGAGRKGPRSASDRSIRISEELRFSMFRHWNLYDAMFHSSYVAGRLELWRERGRKRLQGLLAKMGFSLIQCQQTYSHMSLDLKRSLPQKIAAISTDYNLAEISFPSFVRSFGYKTELSAADVVEAVGGILQVPIEGVKFGGGGAGEFHAEGEHWMANGNQVTWSGTGNEDVNGNVDGEGRNAVGKSMYKKERDWWLRNFWTAWDALGKDSTKLRHALPIAMSIQRSIVRQGTSLIDKQTIRTFRTFRYATISEGPDLPIFSHPSTLLRLGIWLIDAIRDLIGRGGAGGVGPGNAAKGKVKGLPFVLASLDEKKDAYLVVGVTGAMEYGDVRKNKFSKAFQSTIQATKGIRANWMGFDSCAVEIRKDDLQEFTKKLHALL